ncbi:sensor histidine kinase [Cupriavidus plantarum]|uniref:sensor histidine kinase n=1 Tax=Cupriavidus plantarum TaxID=942865 RepID=UPI000E392E57|nr:histidine kinase dimerization/phosphoacceptor domain -containing protein [Cupriavidus plantarum]REE93451.1 signal transduction histidine kinase [Cupriavidus plantarum]
MTGARATTLTAAVKDIVAGPDETVRVQDVLDLHRLFTRLVGAMRSEVTLQQLLDLGARIAAEGAGAPMAKVLELDASDNSLVVTSQFGLSPEDVGRSAGKAAGGNPPGEAIRESAPVVDPDVRRRPPETLPALLKEKGIVTSVNVPLLNEQGAYGVLEVDYPEQVDVSAITLSYLASVASLLAESIEKQRVQRTLAAERDAKAVLLREQQHRIRNNLQMIIAMVQRVGLQVADENRKQLRNVERRVLAMAALYDHLLGLSEQAERADLGRYLTAMSTSFDDFYDLEHNDITLKIALQFGIVADLDACTTIGTIVNELVANAVEHAFDNRPGEITLSLSRLPVEGFTVTVADNGKGLSTPALKENIGLRTVRNMLAHIKGRLDVRSSPANGTAWTIIVGKSPT